ncbi:FG-GAP and VCBS repeat-containing protein [Streptomyces sp. JNUCC 64]
MSWRLKSRLALATATAAALAGGLLTAAGSPAAAAPAAPAKHADDFNGDGFRDYVQRTHGKVVVTYGTATGPGSRTEEFTQAGPGIPGEPKRYVEDSDYFGVNLAPADFNRDGYADLAVSDPVEKANGLAARGMVIIMWGSRSGLGAKATELPIRNPDRSKRFGSALATGDFSGDGKPDLAVLDADGVYVYRGGFSSRTGRTGPVTLHKHRDLRHVTGLVAGKITKDRTTDLYLLSSGWDRERRESTSDVWLLRGGAKIHFGGHRAYRAKELFREGVIADFDRDGYGDLVVPESHHRTRRGAVVVIPGGSGGPGAARRLTQDTPGIATGSREDDNFGSAVATGNLDGDRYPDLVVSAVGEEVAGIRYAGGVHVLRGGPRGLTGTGSRWITRATPGVPGEPTRGGLFGASLAGRDLDRDGHPDVMASDTYRDGEERASSSVVLPGGRDGVRPADAYEVPVTADLP